MKNAWFPSWSTPHGSALIAVLLVIAIALLAGCVQPKPVSSVTLSPYQARTSMKCWRNDWDVRVVIYTNGSGSIQCIVR